MAFVQIGKRLIVLEQVDSTNNYAKSLVQSGEAENGMLVSAGFQSGGRGMYQNTWHSDKDQNLLLSLVLFPEEIQADEQFYISKAIALAIADFLSLYVEHIRIKWPNDIYYKDDKIAGMLIENTLQGNAIKNCICGIGVNINQKKYQEEIPNPTSLSKITHQQYDLKSALNKLITFIEIRYNELFSEDIDAIDEEYQKSLYRFREKHYFKTENERFLGAIKGVDRTGRLQIIKDDGKKVDFGFKEVAFI